MAGKKLKVVLSSGNLDKLREVTQILDANWLEIVRYAGVAGRMTVKRDNMSKKTRYGLPVV